MHHQLGAANRDPGYGPGVSPDHHRAAVHVVPQAPAGVVVDLEAGAVGEAGAEVPRGAAHAHPDRRGQPDADVVAGVGVEDLDVLSRLAVLADQLVGAADRDLGEIYLDHVSKSPGGGSRVSRACPGNRRLSDTSSEATAMRSSSSYRIIGLAASRSLA